MASPAVRHPEIVAACRHYGMAVETCLPDDAQTKGGSEATVRAAKADLVPPEADVPDADPASPPWPQPAAPSARRSTPGPTPRPAGRRPNAVGEGETSADSSVCACQALKLARTFFVGSELRTTICFRASVVSMTFRPAAEKVSSL